MSYVNCCSIFWIHNGFIITHNYLGWVCIIQNLEENIVVVDVPEVVSSNKKTVIHVLHVDDDSSILEVSRQILMDFGNFEVDSVTCVDEAFRKLAAKHFDAIISDYELPEKNGLQFLQELREQKNDISFVLFTGKGREDVVINALNLGADAYVNKQGNPETVYGELSFSLHNAIERKTSKRLHAESEAKYRKLVENSLQGIAIIQGPPPKFVFANLAMGQLFGYSPEELTTLSPEEIAKNVHPDDREAFFNRFEKRMEGKEVESTYEFHGFRKDGTIRWVEVCANLIEYNGRPAVQGVFLDITERKKVEEGLRKSEEMYRSLADSLPEIVFETDKNGKLTYANKRAFEVFGYSKEDFDKGICAFDLFAQKDKQRVIGNFANALANKPSDNIEYTFVRKDGGSFPALVESSAIIGSDGTVSLRGIVIDVSERKKEEALSRKISEEWKRVFDATTDFVFIIDKENRLVNVNKRTCDLLKKTPEELVGKRCYEVMHGTEQPWHNCPHRRALETGESASNEVLDRHLGAPMLVSVSPVPNEKGELVEFVHTAKDITDIKRAEVELHIAANLFDAVTDSILVHDLDGKLVYFNEAAYKSRGYTKDEFQTLTIRDLEVPGNPRFFGDRMKDLFERGDVIFEAVNLRKDKTLIPVEIHARVVEFDDKKMVLSVARDISERKAAEERLCESQEKYETTFESSTDALMLLDENSFLDCNTATLHLFGFSSVDEFTKKHPGDLSPILQLDGSSSPEVAVSHIKKAFWSGKEKFLWVFKRADETTFPADVLFSRVILKNRSILQATVRDITQQKEAEEKLMQAEEKHRTLLNAANVLVQSVDTEGRYVFVNEEWKKQLGYSEGDLKEITMMNVVRKDHLRYCMGIFKQVMDGESIHDVETVFVTKDGKEIFVSGNACPIFKDGKFVSTVAFFVDITERKKNEEKLRESSRNIEMMNEKLRVVGGLTRHDVRNKLSAVTGYAYILKKKHGDLPDVVDGLSRMEQAVAESVKIFDFAKMYEQLGLEELTYIDVEAKLKEAKDLFSGVLPKIINECKGLTVLGDSFLRQLFYNFIDNTRKYGKKTTTIRVHYETTNQDRLKLIYEDDGVGVPLENKPRLFKEGFSTGGSTGFGLFFTKKMMDVYGWQIEENGEPEKGARFTITIPKTNQNGKENYQITKRK